MAALNRTRMVAALAVALACLTAFELLLWLGRPSSCAETVTSEPPPATLSVTDVRFGVWTMNIRGIDPRGPSGVNVVTYSSKLHDLGDIVLRNIEQYSARYDYTLVVQNTTLDPLRPVVWSKILGARKLLETHDWVLVLDADVVVANMSTTIEMRLRQLTAADGANAAPCTADAEIIVAVMGSFGLNAGVLLLRSTPRVVQFLDDVYTRFEFLTEWQQEQGAIKVELERRHNATWVCLLEGAHSRLLQVFPVNTSIKENLEHTYQRGDWLLHFAGSCRPWCRQLAQLAALCALRPQVAECATAMTLQGWQPSMQEW
jgi:hypothetical protein